MAIHNQADHASNGAGGQGAGGSAQPFDEHAAFEDILDDEPVTPRKPARRASAADLLRDPLDDPQGDLGDEGDDAGQEADDQDDLADQRDDDAPPDLDADPDADEDPTVLARKVRVTVDGQEQVLTVDELRRGYQRHADYTRKTQEVAQHRQVFVDGLGHVASQREVLDNGLQQLAAAIAAQGPQRLSQAEMEQLYVRDPLQFTKLQADYAMQDRKLAEIEGMRHQNAAEAQRARQAQVQQIAVVEAQRLLDKYPEWKNPAKGAAAKQALLEYATQVHGFTPAEIGGVLDHRMLDVLNKARLYDAAVARAQTQRTAPTRRVVQQGAGVPSQRGPRTAEPGAAAPVRDQRAKRAVQAQSRLAKTGRLDDAAAAFELIL